MDQMEMLWAFMQEDIKVDRIMTEIKRSPMRQKAEKARDLFLEQQKAMKALEETVAVQTDRKDAIRDAVKRCEEQLKQLLDRAQANPPQSLEDTQALLSDVEKLRATIADYENEVSRIAKRSNEHTTRANKIRATAAAAKQEFDMAKAEYEKESKEKKASVEQLRAAAAAKSEGIPANLMEEYQSIKKHIMPPLARLISGACSGCNTSQPSALLRKIEAGEGIVECETCGRMLIK